MSFGKKCGGIKKEVTADCPSPSASCVGQAACPARKRQARRLAPQKSRLNSELCDPTVQRTQAHAEAAGGFLLVWKSAQQPHQMLPLKATHGFAQVIDQRRIGGLG